MEKKIIFSETFRAGNRTYFFDIKETTEKKRYLSITESKKIDDNFERFRLMIFEEDIEPFSKHFNSALLNFFKVQDSNQELSFMDSQRQQNKNAYKPWKEDDDKELEILYCKGKTNSELSQYFQRNLGSIRSRVKKLELADKYPDIR